MRRRKHSNVTPILSFLLLTQQRLLECCHSFQPSCFAGRASSTIKRLRLHGTGSDSSDTQIVVEADAPIDVLDDFSSSSSSSSSSSIMVEPSSSSAELSDKASLELEHTQYPPIYPNISAIKPLPDKVSDFFAADGDDEIIISRRTWMTKVAGSVLIGGAAVGGTAVYRYWNETETAQQQQQQPKKLEPVNITAVAKETRINITIQCSRTCVTLDETTFQKKQTLKLPSWVPAQWVPPPKVIKDIPNSELLIAAIVAGASIEMVRTTLLYPLQTLKTRIQTDINTRERSSNRQLHIQRRLKVMRLKTIRHFREGQLYAGLRPSLLISVPATGCYYAARDISKRMLAMTPFPINDIYMALAAAFFADVISLALRTPADTLAIRLQAATGGEGMIREHDDDQVAEKIADALAEARVEEKVGNWFIESLERLPAVIATDLPYLLSRIALNNLLIQGQVLDVGHYELTAFTSAIVCAFITTPFDVARTRILVDSDADVRNGIDGGSRKGLLETFQIIVNEGGGGIRNLFAGWLERTTYLGISSLWLPFALILYTAIRNTILLEVFD